MKNLSPYEYNSVCRYFYDFVELNKKSNVKNKFTIRSFSTEINWPSSLLNDLISNRKNLTCIRAIEFGQFTKLSPHEIEYLIFLGLKSNMPEKINSYFSKNILGSKNNLPQTNLNQASECRNVNFLLFITVLSWSNGRITLDKIKSLLSEKHITSSEIDEFVADLKKKKSVHFKNGKPVLLNISNFSNDEYCDGTNVFASHVKFDEVEAKIIALRNFLSEVGDEKNLKRSKNHSKIGIFQFDLNLIPVLKKKELDDILK